jgi:hypothetical protein
MSKSEVGCAPEENAVWLAMFNPDLEALTTRMIPIQSRQ